MAKIAGLALIVAVAFYSRQWVQSRSRAAEAGPEQAADLAGARSFRRGLVVEIAIGAALLAIAAALVQAVPGRAVSTIEADELGQPASTSFSTVIKADGVTVQVQLDPAAVGGNSLHLYAFTPDNEPQKVLEWKAYAALPEGGIDRVDIPVLAITANHAVGEVQLPKAGEWTFTFTVRISDIDQKTVSRNIGIT